MTNKLVLTVMVMGLLSGTSAIASAHGMDVHGGKSMHCHDGGHGGGLSPEKEKVVHEAMHKVFAENKPLFQKMESLHKELHDIMSADKFDANTYLKKAGEIDALDEKIHKNMERGIVAAAAQLSPHERKEFMEHMMMHKGHEGHGGPWGHHGHGDHGDQHGDWQGEHHGEWQQHDGHGPAHDDNGGSPRQED